MVVADEGFGQEMMAALNKRKQVLANMGHATDLGDGHVPAPRDLIQRLQAADIERAGKALAADRGMRGPLYPATTSPASLSAPPSYPAAGSR
jgi:hypothetical protein